MPEDESLLERLYRSHSGEEPNDEVRQVARNYAITPKGILFIYLTDMGIEYEKAVEICNKFDRDVMMSGYVYSYVGVTWEEDSIE